MIVSHEHKTIFVHVPKCAGTSIRTALKSFHDEAMTLYGVKSVPGFFGGCVKDLCHLTPSEVSQLLKIDTSKYLHIIVTRDPVSRWISAYTEHQRHCRDFFKGHNVLPPLTLLREIVHWKETGDSRLSTDTKYIHMRPQVDYTISYPMYFLPMQALGDANLQVKAADGTTLLRGPISRKNAFGTAKKSFAHAEELQRMKNGDLARETRELILRAYKEDFLLHDKTMIERRVECHRSVFRVYWINLDKHADRRVHMQDKLGETSHRRVMAVEPPQVKDVKNPGRDVKETACLCSHLHALSLALIENSRDEWFMICEDDIFFPFGSAISIKKLIDSSPKDAEILQLCTVNPSFYMKKAKPLWTRWSPVNYGTQAYAIKRNAAEKLLRMIGIYPSNGSFVEQLSSGVPIFMDKLKGLTVADDCLYRTCCTYTCSIPIVIGVDFGSDIHTHHLPLQSESWKSARQVANSEEGRKVGLLFQDDS